MSSPIITEINLCTNPEDDSVTVWAAAVNFPEYILQVDEDFDDVESAWCHADWLSELTGVYIDSFFLGDHQ